MPRLVMCSEDSVSHLLPSFPPPSWVARHSPRKLDGLLLPHAEEFETGSLTSQHSTQHTAGHPAHLPPSLSL